MKYLVFDIETRVDKGLVRAIYYPNEAISDDEAYQRIREQLLREQRSDFIPLSFHVPVCVVLGSIDDDLRLVTIEALGEGVVSEGDLAEQFWNRVESLDGTLVSFNGRAFDLPVMELQALRHGVEAPRYFNERYGPRYRYSDRHYDLYEFITNAGASRIRGGLDLLSKMIGLPGKGEVDGSAVQSLWEAGELDAIRQYCRRDVIQTYLLFLRIERMRGRINPAQLGELWSAAASLRSELDG